MNKMFFKRVVGAVTAAAVFMGINSAVFAADTNDTGYATREYVVSEFVKSVGRSNLEGSGYVLSTFTDAGDVDEEYVTDMEKAASNGLIRGYEDKTIRPKENITRVEALTILARCVPETDDLEGEAIEFTDVPEWAKHDMDGLTKAGLVKGYGDGTLGAEDNITVEQVKLLTDRSDALLNTVSPGESFYGYVNNKVFRNYEEGSRVTIDSLHGVVIPNDNSWSYMSDMYNTVVENEKEILGKLVNDELDYEDGTPAQRIHDMLKCIDRKDEKNDSDTELYNKYRGMLIGAKNTDEFLKAVNDIYVETGINPLFTIEAGLEPMEHRVYPQVKPLSAGYGGLIAFSSEAKSKYDDKYHELLKNCVETSGLEFTDSDLEKACELQERTATGENYATQYAMGRIVRMTYDPTYTQEQLSEEMNKIMAEHPEMLDEETGDLKDTSSMIEVYNLADADKKFSYVKLSDMLKNAGYHDFDCILMPTTGCIEASRDIFSDDNLTALKINALVTLVQIFQISDGEEQRAYDKLSAMMFAVITGWDYEAAENYFVKTQADMKLAEEEAMADSGEGKSETERLLSDANLQQLGALLPNDIGLLYCENYYSDDISETVSDMVTDIWNAYIKRFENNSWMSEETKKNAIKKIENMVAVIGYPDNYEFPDIIPVEEGGTYFKNILNISKDNLKTNIRYCGEDEFIRTIMVMSPDTVNACYIPILNIMNIPAGFLGWPIYDENASYEANLGSIGAVIAHEIGHAFDAEGSKFDENGCLKDWWTEEDAKIFEQKKQEFVDYY
ncbi:MAG: M13-type metalloendopeptidase, partial [Monoglobaceae bacterium]